MSANDRVSHFGVGVKLGAPTYRGAVPLRNFPCRHVLVSVSRRASFFFGLVIGTRRSNFRVGGGALAERGVARTSICKGVFEDSCDRSVNFVRRPGLVDGLRDWLWVVNKGGGHLINEA